MSCDRPGDREDPAWLSIREQYRTVDFSVLKSDRALWLIRQEPDLAAELEYRAKHHAQGYEEEYARYEAYMLYQVYEDHQEHEELEAFGKHDDRLGQEAGKAIRRTHHSPGLLGNKVPITHTQDIQLSDSREYVRFRMQAIGPVTWRGKTPTPPPRYT